MPNNRLRIANIVETYVDILFNIIAIIISYFFAIMILGEQVVPLNSPITMLLIALNLLLLTFVFLTFVLNVELSATTNILKPENNAFNAICSFITMQSEPTSQMLLDSFKLFGKIDIILIIITAIVFVLEMRVLFKATSNK